jgi:hypothetical protein
MKGSFMRVFTRWDEVSEKGETDGFLQELALWHLGKVTENFPEREHLIACVTRNDVSALCDFNLTYPGLSPSDGYHVRQVLAFYSKRKDLDLGIDRRAAALSKFDEAEALCQESNEIFRLWGCGQFQFCPRVEAVLHGSQRKISSILGRTPLLSELDYRFGPGATTAIPKRNASARRKLGQGYFCSEDFAPIASAVLAEMPAWIPFGDSETALVDIHICDSRLDFVPKTAKVDRSIAVEPVLNQMFQLGLGDWIAKRLRRIGVNTRDQSRNQRLAKEGSLTGALATLDLSSASDTVSKGIVAHLLPFDWVSLLNYGRCSHYTFDNVRKRFQKFSSMGNGFTFPLETLIFYALAFSATEAVGASTENVSVYGDDIIIPVEAYSLLCDTLHSVGFIPNPAKSFASGPFRESCGKDYLSGIDIRPCYIKDILDCSTLFVLHNFYVRRGLVEPADLILSRISESLRLFGPDGYGDGHLLGEWLPRPHRRSKGYCGFTFETFTWKGRKDFRPYPGDFVYPSYCIYVSPSLEGLPDFPVVPAPGRSLGFRDPCGRTFYDKSGRLGVTLPGARGYKSISIYTLRA